MTFDIENSAAYNLFTYCYICFIRSAKFSCSQSRKWLQLKCITIPRTGRAECTRGKTGEYFRMLSGCALARTATKCNLTVHDSRARTLFIANTAPHLSRRHPLHTSSLAVSRYRKPGYLNRLIESTLSTHPSSHQARLYRIKRSTLIFRSAKLLFSRFVRRARDQFSQSDEFNIYREVSKVCKISPCLK